MRGSQAHRELGLAVSSQGHTPSWALVEWAGREQTVGLPMHPDRADPFASFALLEGLRALKIVDAAGEWVHPGESGEGVAG